MYTQINIKSRTQINEVVESVSFDYDFNGETHSLETLFPVGATEADVLAFLEL